MGDYFTESIEAKLLNLHTTYLAKVVTVGDDFATVQPLTMIKQYGKAAKRQAPIAGVPISSHCKGKVVEKELRYVSGISDHSPNYSTVKILQFEPLKAGDIVVCSCSERDITEARAGNISLPTGRRHSLSDSIILGVL